MKKACNVVKNVIFIIVVIIISFGIIGNLSSKNSNINNIVKFSNYVIVTGSMEPSISPGDFVTVLRVPLDKLKIDDVITYKDEENSNVTHQIINIEGDTIITQGTANNVSDKPISYNQVQGKYMFKISKIGYLMAFLSSTSGLILVGGLFAIYIFWELTDENKKNKKKGVNISKEEYEELIKLRNNKESND